MHEWIEECLRDVSGRCFGGLLEWLTAGLVFGSLNVARCWGNHSIYLIKSLKYKRGWVFLAFFNGGSGSFFFWSITIGCCRHCFVYSLLCRDYTTFCGLRMIRNSHQKQKQLPKAATPNLPHLPHRRPEKKLSFCRLFSALNRQHEVEKISEGNNVQMYVWTESNKPTTAGESKNQGGGDRLHYFLRELSN